MADAEVNAKLTRERRGRGSLLSDWCLANAAKQKFDLENAVLQKTFGGPFATIPFGSNVTIQQASQNGLWGKLIPLGLSAALGAGTFGLGSLAVPALMSLLQPSVQPPQVTPAQQGPIEFPVNIDWSFAPNGGSVRPKQP